MPYPRFPSSDPELVEQTGGKYLHPPDAYLPTGRVHFQARITGLAQLQCYIEKYAMPVCGHVLPHVPEELFQ